MNHSGGDKNNDNSGFTLLRYTPVVTAVVSIVIFAILCLLHHDTVDLVKCGALIMAGVAAGFPILNVLVSKQQRRNINYSLIPFFVLGLIFILVGTHVALLKENLRDSRTDAVGYRKLLQDEDNLYFKRGTPWLAHQFLLANTKVTRVRILGINALGIIHTHRQDLKNIIEGGGTLEILLLKGRLPKKLVDNEEEAKPSNAFTERVLYEEGTISKRKGWIANRIQAEWEASIAILADIFNQLLATHRIKDLEQRFEIRFHKEHPKRSMLFVERNETNEKTGKSLLKKYLVLNRYSKSKNATGKMSLSLLVDEDWIEYTDGENEFERLWKSANPLPLKKLEKMIDKLPDAQSLEQLYKRARLYHEQHRLDEASHLYEEVLQKETPTNTSEQHRQLVRKFLPRVFTTEKEPFRLKDLVVVIHPSKRLIGYHLVWEDDIDFLIDNDPGDHEIVWIKYDEAQEQVEKVWAYWHGKIYQTEEAVADANSHDSRVAIYVQWGKHGSLLEGWEEIIKINGDKNVEEFEPLQYNRLNKGRNPAKGFYADHIPVFFDGTEEEFETFTTDIELQEHLRKKEMIVVSKYANAVIDQWFLPYNICPKPDWPRD